MGERAAASTSWHQSQPDAEGWRLSLRGRWCLEQLAAIDAAIPKLSIPRDAVVVLDAGELKALDSAGAMLLVRRLWQAGVAWPNVRRDALPARHRHLLDLVEQRFELLRKQAECDMLRQQVRALRDGKPLEADRLQIEFDAFSQQLQMDCDFLRQANIGGEYMTPEHKQRVDDIAAYQLQSGGKHVNFLSEDEVYNLKIERGTLTAEERTVINNHIVVTIHMLESLPYPKDLKRVPEYAGGHHERMDGKGYPRGLKREEMSVPARVMGIADIFEDWFRSGCADGFVVMPPYFPGAFDDFVDLVVPELQRRGIYRKEYTGSTLRDHLSA